MILAPRLSDLPRRITVFIVLYLAQSLTAVFGHVDLPLDRLNLRAGFELSVYAEVINPRQLALAPGVVFAGSRRAGNVYALVDRDGDHVAEQVITIDDNLKMPSGIAYRDGNLYVAAVSRILVYRNILQYLQQGRASVPEPEVLYDRLPDKHHGWKYIDFGPDNYLYFNVGAPCNICLSEDPRFATIMRINLAASDPEPEIFAHGVRNSVGFAWHPETEELWFTDNGRDHLGDELPPCELNRAPEAGLHFGYPFRHGRDVIDPKYGDHPTQPAMTAPVLELGAHVAPLGMLFYTGQMFPDDYRNQVFIAEHGSWNRSPRAGHVGYRITLARGTGQSGLSYENFIDGWLDGRVGWGRPVDLMQLPDGSLLISDDTGNVVYRLTYRSH